MADTDTVSVPREKYEAMQQAVRLLRALQAQGVDNWDGYHFAVREVYGDEED